MSGVAVTIIQSDRLNSGNSSTSDTHDNDDDNDVDVYPQRSPSSPLPDDDTIIPTTTTTTASTGFTEIEKEKETHQSTTTDLHSRKRGKMESDCYQRKQHHQQAKGAVCTSGDRSSSCSIGSKLSPPPPPSNSLDRQRAGLVQPNPGAYAITHPDCHYQEDSSSNSNTTSESEIGSTTTLESPSLFTATTTAMTTATTDDGQRSYDRDNNHSTIQNENNHEVGGTSSSLLLDASSSYLIEAKLVESSVFALEVSPVDEVAKQKRRRNIQIFIFVGFLLVVVICVVPPVLIEEQKKEKKVVVFQSSNDTFYAKHGYECFTSTDALNIAQIIDFIQTNYTTTKDTYVICPDTTIDIGVQTSPGVVKRGDYPLIVLTSNTTIQCDAAPMMDDDNDDSTKGNDNTCVIHGGLNQVFLWENVAPLEWWMNFFQNEEAGLDLTDDDVTSFFHSLSLHPHLHNVTIRGLTFTGTIVDDEGHNQYEHINKYGHSIIVNQTGTITLDDCTWKDMHASTGVILVALSSIDDPTGNHTKTRHSSQLTIQNSHFINIGYNHQLIDINNQLLVLQNTTFENIIIVPSSIPCTHDLNSDWIGKEHDCTYLLSCEGDAICEITDSCRIENRMEFPEGYDDKWLYQSTTATVRINAQSHECGFQ